MRRNPPWANKAIKDSFPMMERAGLPLPKGSKWKFKELGCGYFGCVIPTDDPDIVLKLTSDNTEARFVKEALDLHKNKWPIGICRYLNAVLDLDATKPDEFGTEEYLYALWRERANKVGYKGSIEDLRDFADAGNKLIRAIKFGTDRDYQRTLQDLNKALEFIIEDRDLHFIGKALKYYFENEILILDLHTENLGTINGIWKIIDPGDVQFLFDL